MLENKWYYIGESSIETTTYFEKYIKVNGLNNDLDKKEDVIEKEDKAYENE